MEKNLLKNYKLTDTEKQLKNNSLVFFYHMTNLSMKSKIKTEQQFVKKKLKAYKINNNLAKIVLKKSIFLNNYSLINGSLSFVLVKNYSNITKKVMNLFELNQNYTLIGVKLNNRLYAPKQLTNLKTLEYKKNINSLNQGLKRNLKHFFYVTAKNRIKSK